jgi:hypothetical protein
MKLTKGRISKILKKHNQTFKASNKNITNNMNNANTSKTMIFSKHNFTLRKKQALNLINKTLHNYDVRRKLVDNVCENQLKENIEI